MSRGTQHLCTKNNVSILLMSLIPCKSCPIYLSMDLEYFWFSGPFMRCQYYCTLPVYGHMTALILPGWMETYPVMVFLMYQLSPIGIIVMGVGEGVWFFLGGIIVAMWLTMMSWPLIHLAIVFYLWTVGMRMGFPSYWCGDFGMAYMSSGIMCGAFCDGWGK